MILSILIPTIKGREKQFNALEEFLQWQINQASVWNEVEIKSLCDNKEMSIGAKRNELLKMASGDYCIMIDDDDTVDFRFIELVLLALEKKPDCIGYKELCIYEGKRIESSIFSKKYKDWQENFDGFNHVRTPFYKAPIKTELCRNVGFKDLRYAEDHDFAKRIYPLLKTEEYIDEFMYIYRYKHEPHNLKYGIGR